MTPSNPTTGRGTVGHVGGHLRWLLPASLLVVLWRWEPVEPSPNASGIARLDPQERGERAATRDPRVGERSGGPAAVLAGKVIPEPPGQGTPWTAPATKLPRSLVEATAVLFEGVADPRGCEYREVEVEDREWRRVQVKKARGFVLPERPGEARRFVVGWDGIVHSARVVGAKADLEADVRELAAALKKSRESPRFHEHDSTNFRTGVTTKHRERISPFDDDRGPAPAVLRSPLVLGTLLRLGRADLAESLYAAATTWTPETAWPDLLDPDISLPRLSRGWADAVYSRLIGAHCTGDDAVALDAARRLDRFRKSAAASGLKLEAPLRPLGMPEMPPACVRNAMVITELLADQERRATEGLRGPVPPAGGDPAARIAALIRDFDQIHVRRPEGGAHPGDGAIVAEVVAEGDPAVGPLLVALESETRRTRCIDSRAGHDWTLPAIWATHAALQRLLETERFMDDGSDYSQMETAEGRKRLAAAARALWERNRAVPLGERWYRVLRDDSAGAARWIEAASRLVQPPGPGASFLGHITVRKPWRPEPTALTGEPLRRLRHPSVSELLARRCREIAEARTRPGIFNGPLDAACELAIRFTRWDEVGSIATIRALMTTCLERSRGPGPAPRAGDQARYIAEFTMVRARAGDRAALDDYAAWIRPIGPETIGDLWRDLLEPLWTHPDHPAMSAAARAMFLEPGSPWLPLVPVEEGRHHDPYMAQIASPLVCVPAYREALLTALADRTRIGTAVRQPRGVVQYTLAPRRPNGSLDLRNGLSDERVPDPTDTPGVEVPIRMGDCVAWKLSALDGAPECRLTWPESRRDESVAACAAYLRRHGPQLAAEADPDDTDAWHPVARLRFPALGRPATPDDLRAGRAVFSAAGEGEARAVALPSGFPIRARWLALKSFPVDRSRGTNPTSTEFLQDGWAWQAEEVLKGGRWERSYGFIGHATIARVPASEIEFPPDRAPRPNLPGGLAARLESAGPPGTAFRPGRPIPIVLRIHNVRGVEQSAPTEFGRAAADGKPALRRGISLVLVEMPRGDGLGSPSRTREPSRTAHFDPGDASRTLAPTESFEALRLDLNNWYTGLQPGLYWLQLTFGADSGVGEGATNEMAIRVVEPGRQGP